MTSYWGACPRPIPFSLPYLDASGKVQQSPSQAASVLDVSSYFTAPVPGGNYGYLPAWRLLYLSTLFMSLVVQELPCKDKTEGCLPGVNRIEVEYPA